MNIKGRKRGNLRTAAIYNVLFAENRHRQKALVTITLEDQKLTSLFKLRKALTYKINKILERVRFKGQNIAYFTNIELGMDKGALTSKFNPHIHIQYFFDDYEPIKLALTTIEAKFNFKNIDVQQANEEDAYFGYVIKDYIEANFDEEREINKVALGMKKPFYTNSRSRSLERKNIPNYIIRYIYSYYKIHAYYQVWKPILSNERYQFILDNIRDSQIIIKPSTEQLPAKFKTVKNYKIYIKI